MSISQSLLFSENLVSFEMKNFEDFLSNLRVGVGFDVHPFSRRRRKLRLGGVEIDFQGLEGVSDADVLFHAVADAIAGASELQDIGKLFPPETSKGISSKKILREVVKMAEKKGKIVFIDTVVIAQKPRLGQFTEKMKDNLRKICNCPVNVKIKSPEGLGALGRSEGIASFAICIFVMLSQV